MPPPGPTDGGQKSTDAGDSRAWRPSAETMNKLPTAGSDRWALPRHAHVVVFEAEAGDELITIYDCGVAQAPPSAQFRGHLVRIRADRSVSHTPIGYRAQLREPGLLIDQGADHYVIEARS